MRCLLFTPALRTDRALRAWAHRPDAVILDLEDAVPHGRKVEARGLAAAAIAALQEPWSVRINALDTPWWREDLDAVMHPNLDSLVIPKVRSADDIFALVDILHGYERSVERSRPIRLFPIIESVEGLENARAIGQASGRVAALTFGEGDFSLDLGIDWDPFGTTLAVAKVKLVLDSRLAGIDPPHAGVYPRLGDPDGLERSCELAKSLGFGAKHCIHPEQIATILRTFTPSQRAVERAREIVARFEAALAGGSAAIMLGGEFIDYPVYHRAQKTLEEAMRT